MCSMAHLLTNDSIQLVTLRTADAGKVLDLLLNFEHAVVIFPVMGSAPSITLKTSQTDSLTSMYNWHSHKNHSGMTRCEYGGRRVSF